MDDPVYEAFREIKTRLSQTISSLNEQIRRAQLEYVENMFQQQKNSAGECLEGIDDQLIKLSIYVEEYQRLWTSLKNLTENTIPELGGTPPPIPETLGGDTLAAILAERIGYLKSQGKI